MGLLTARDWDSAPPYQLGLRPNLCIPYEPQSASLPYQLAPGTVFYLDAAYTVWCHRVGQVLSTPLLRGNGTTRAAYQAPAIIRPILAVIAVVGKDPGLHGAVVKLLHAFLYTRFLIFASKRIRLTKVQSQATIYAQSVFLGAILAIQAAGLPGGVAVYIGAVGVVMVLSRCVSNHLSRSREAARSASLLDQLLVRPCLWIGLTELGSIRAHQPLALASCANDEYTDDKAVGGDQKVRQSRRSSKQG
ncbi:hypothetical protein F53441_5537 [Fusarium austroafricanum]|uniref:Uncharacterized protein n=1 Tax=Fusarium austroafricanum TaxID=2364996 RepID=A0A8H4KHN7_9HYPO|nr:hypothetical protein F53441_5537 [Fusarium austroafricanum]